MSVRPILAWPDVRLSAIRDPVQDGEDLNLLIADMFDTMYDATGRGLAAPQIGLMKRVFVMDVTWKEAEPSPIAMINPEMTWCSEETVVMTEGCLSIQGITTDIERPAAVEFAWTSPEGLHMVRRMEGAEARCALHELDHLNGVVTLDRLSDEDRNQALRAYENANA